MLASADHPDDDVDRAIQEAREAGWTFERRGGRGHAWGVLRSAGGESSVYVWSTPRNPANHARQIRRAVIRAPPPSMTRAAVPAPSPEQLPDEHRASTAIGEFRTVSNDLLDALALDPSLLHHLHWRTFEELVAELLSRQGFDVYLTPPSADRGVDIYAKRSETHGPVLYVVECKRYDIDRAVGPELVRTLFGVVERERATRGILATTSVFTVGAREEAGGDLAYRLSLRDAHDIQSWIHLARPPDP